TPIANRTQQELEGMIGFFVNTLALRMQVNEENSFQAMLQEVKQTTLGAYDHQQVPFEKVVERVVKTRDMSVSPLFQVLFVLQNTPDTEGTDISSTEGLKFSHYEGRESVTAKFDLTITVNEKSNGQFSVNINYRTDLFKEETIERMLVHYQQLLTAIVASPSAQLSTVTMIQEEERTQLLEAFDNTDVNYPADKTIIDLFEEQVIKVPEAIAAVYEDESLSYQQLDERSNQLARYLMSKGVKSDDLVGICVNHNLDMLVGLLGILKSGGAYVPIDPAYPQSRIDYMLEDSGVKLVLSTNDHVTRITEKDQLDIILLDSEWSQIAKRSVGKPKKQYTLDNLAYVIYTSGSTGKPKGVLIEHRNVVHLFRNDANLFDFSSDDVWTLFHSFCFDFSVWEIYGALLFGGKLVIVPNSVTKDAKAFSDLMLDEGVTVLNQTPGAFYTLQNEFMAIAEKTAIRYVIFGGEALNPGYLANWKDRYPDCKLINMYGITETTVHVTYKEITAADIDSTVSTIGRAIPTLSCYILDEHLNLVPRGVVGELCIGGSGVARGYLNREALNNERFVSNPFSEDSNSRLYKSGDLGRLLPDGNIEYIGRKDTQVKVRGYRIELGEIENALSLLPQVNQCCVLAKEDSTGNNRLIAYVVAENKPENDWKAVLKASLGEGLPEYMVPQLWVQLDEMPLTSNGKLDKKALPELDSSTLSSKEYVAPTTALETQLAEIWQDLLGVEKVGIYDNFFELGGHSLLVVRLIARIQDIGYTVNVRDIFSYPSITQLSPRLALKDDYQAPANAILPGSEYITPEMVNLVELSQEELEKIMDNTPGGAVNIQDIYPLSSLQKGIYFHHLMSDRSSGDPYVISTTLSFSTVDQRSEFVKALNFIVSRHDILRTFILNEGLPEALQVVMRNAELAIEELSIDDNQDVLSRVQKETEAGNLWINPSVAPMLQVKVADDLVNGKYYLILNHHHLIMDHIGLEKVKQEIMLYLSGKAELLPTPALYRDFIADTLRKEKIEASEQYFSTLYGNISEPTYPFNFSDNQVDGSTSIVTSRIFLPAELRDAVREVSGNLQMSPAVFFYAAFGLVVGRCSNKDYALFGSIFLGRLQGSKGSESSLGLFMNTLPVLLDLKGDVAAYISRTNEHLQKLIDFEQTPLSDVQDWSGISNDVPMFSTLLNYRHSRQETTPAGAENTLDIGIEYAAVSSRNNLPFNFDVDDYGNEFSLAAKISDVGIDPAAIVSYMVEALTVLIKGIREESSFRLADLSIVPAEEQHQLLELFNETDNSLPSDAETVVDLFEAQAANTPLATAVVYEGEFLTYQELNDHSNQLARYLKNQGVTSDVLVGICIDRSLEMMIAILGIMKAGGAYVPIDPEYPQDRRDHMLEDSAVSILLSDNQNSSGFSDKEDLEVITLDDSWNQKFGKRSVKNLKRIASPSNLAYLIYTSGSTGKPKGVQITHHNLMDYFHGLVDKTNVRSCDSFGLSSSIATDLGNTVVYASLLTGGRLHVLSEDELISAEKMSKLDIDCLKMVPSHWKTLQTKEAVFVPNKCLILGGEAFTDDVLDILTTNQVSCEVYNHYGPTETTIGKLIHKVSLTEDYRHSVPLGAPFGNNRVYVLDDHNMLCPIGVVGELCIGGAGVAKGYLNRESLTAEKFVNNPFK
ncbi:MAG: amino acid adenylation domain-containing protein, partial [Bacteroidota bacterium]